MQQTALPRGLGNPIHLSMAVFPSMEQSACLAVLGPFLVVWTIIPGKSSLRKGGRVSWLVSYQLAQAEVIWEE